MNIPNARSEATLIISAMLALLAVLALLGLNTQGVADELNQLGTTVASLPADSLVTAGSTAGPATAVPATAGPGPTDTVAATSQPASPTPTASRTPSATSEPATSTPSYHVTQEGTPGPEPEVTDAPATCVITVGMSFDGPSGDGYSLVYYRHAGDTAALGLIPNGTQITISLFRQVEGVEWMQVDGYGWAEEGPRAPALDYPDCWAVPAELEEVLPPTYTPAPAATAAPLDPTSVPTAYYVGSRYSYSVNLRSAPGTWASIAGSLAPCSTQQAEVLDVLEDGEWFQVRVVQTGIRAYVASYVVDSCVNVSAQSREE